MYKESVGRMLGWSLVGACLLVLCACSDPEATRAKYRERGEALLASGQFEKARVEFLNALRIDANDADARYGAGQAFEKVGSFSQALGHYLAAVEVNPSHVPSRLALARLFTLGRQVEPATEHANKVLEVDPTNTDARALQASLLVVQGSPDEARKILEGVIAEVPAHAIAVPVLASMMMNEGDASGAKGVISKAVEQSPKDTGFRAVYAQILSQAGDEAGYLAQLKILTELEPDVEQHFVVLGRALAKAGRSDEAKRLLKVRALDSESRIAYLQFLVETGAANEAETEFARFLTEDPKDDETRFALGQFLERTGRSEDAERSYRELMASSASDSVTVKTTLALARLLLARSDFAASKELIADVRKAHPSNQQAVVLAGQMAMAKGDPDAAVAEFRLALRDDPQNLDLYRLLAAAYFANGQPELARETLERAVAVDSKDLEAKAALVQVRIAQRDDVGAEAIVDEMLLLAPTNLFALEQKYKIHLRKQRVDDAIAVADEIANLYPRSGIGPFYAGAALQVKGETERAIARYREALERQPGAAEPLSMLVRTYLADGKVDAAQAVLNDQLKQVKEPFLVQKFLGDVEASRNKPDAAAAFYAQSLRGNDKFVLTYVALARLELSRGRAQEQLRVLRQGVDATDDPKLHVELAEALLGLGHTDEAIEVYRGAVLKHAREKTLANNLAMLLAEYTPTPENLNQALELARSFEGSDNPALLDTLGWVYFKRGELEPSERLLKRAVALAPKSGLLQYHLAKVLADLGNASEALALLETAIASGQRFAGIEDAQSMRDRLSQS